MKFEEHDLRKSLWHEWMVCGGLWFDPLTRRVISHIEMLYRDRDGNTRIGGPAGPILTYYCHGDALPAELEWLNHHVPTKTK